MTAIPKNPAPDFLFLNKAETDTPCDCHGDKRAIIWVDGLGLLCYVPEAVCL